MNDMSERPRPAPAPTQANQQMTATLEAQEWNLVLGAINEVAMPMRLTRPVFDKLVEQLNKLPPV